MCLWLGREQVLGYKEAFKTNWEKINPEAVANASQAEFYWSLSLACSRLFDASKPSESETALYVDPAGDEEGDLLPPGTEEDEEALGGGGTVLGMLPVADFLNHATSYSVEWIVSSPVASRRCSPLLRRLGARPGGGVCLVEGEADPCWGMKKKCGSCA